VVVHGPEVLHRVEGHHLRPMAIFRGNVFSTIV
jgi:hypothetical protein